jgi:hypothetical protein
MGDVDVLEVGDRRVASDEIVESANYILLRH